MHPVLFHLPAWIPLVGGWPLHAYGMMLGLSFVLGCGVTMELASRDGFTDRLTRRVLLAAVAGAVIGGRALFLIVNPAIVGGPGAIGVHEGGMVALGGMAGGILGAAIVCRLSGADFLRFADHAAPTLALGLGLTRIGCFLNGCCFGGRTDSSLGVRFPEGSPAFLHHAELGWVGAGSGWSLPVHPVQIAASLNGFLGLALLAWVYRRRRFPGQVLLVFGAWYGVTRFFLEILRDDPQRGSVLGLSTSQLTSLVAIGAVAWTWRWVSGRRALRTAQRIM